MAVRFRLPSDSLLNDNANPLAGGTVSFYETGTTTPLDTYSDDDLSTANTNPVTLDAAGRHGDIFLKAQDYKAIVKDASGNVIKTMDPIHGQLGLTLSGSATDEHVPVFDGTTGIVKDGGVGLFATNNLSDVSDADTAAENINACIAVSEPSSRNLNLQKWLYGGRVHTGIPTDSLFTDLNDALQEAKTRKTSVMVSGSWELSQATAPDTNASETAALFLPAGVDLIGQGRQQTQLYLADAADCKLLAFEDPAQVDYSQTVSGIHFNGMKDTQTDATQQLIYLAPTASSALARFTLDDIYIRQSKGVSLYLGSYLRAAFTGKCSIYKSGATGGDAALEAYCSDGIHGFLDIGLSDGAGALFGGSGIVQGIKVWRSGETDSDNGWGCRIASPGVIWNGWSQDNALDGLELLGTSGNPVIECDVNHYSDSDGRNGLNLGNYTQYNRCRITARKRTGGQYTPSRIVGFSTTSCDHNTIEAINDGTVNYVVDPTTPNVGSNTLKIASIPDVWVAVTYAATVTPAVQSQRYIAITQTGNLTIGTPTGAYNGADLFLKLKQDSTGSRTITLPSNFAVSWTPSTTASKTNILHVRYDATDAKWYQISAQVGL